MKKLVLILAATGSLITAGCTDEEAHAEQVREEKAKPTFMFWCFRKEIVSTEFRIPEMKTQAAATYIQNWIKGVPGYVESSVDLPSHTLEVRYESSTVRKMNFEEAIALAGFSANNRPANPKAKIPEGIL